MTIAPAVLLPVGAAARGAMPGRLAVIAYRQARRACNCPVGISCRPKSRVVCPRQLSHEHGSRGGSLNHGLEGAFPPLDGEGPHDRGLSRPRRAGCHRAPRRSCLLSARIAASEPQATIRTDRSALTVRGTFAGEEPDAALGCAASQIDSASPGSPCALNRGSRRHPSHPSTWGWSMARALVRPLMGSLPCRIDHLESAPEAGRRRFCDRDARPNPRRAIGQDGCRALSRPDRRLA